MSKQGLFLICNLSVEFDGDYKDARAVHQQIKDVDGFV